MIYESTIKAPADNEFEIRMEAASDELCRYTLAEATAIVLGEQEANWTKFMTAVGLSELATISEGQQVVYEGERLEAFKAKAIAFFESLREKLDKVVKAFIAKVGELVSINNNFIKVYGTKMAGIPTPSGFSYRGYTFNGLDNNAPKFASLESLKDNMTKEEMIESLVGKVEGETFTEKLAVYYQGSKEKVIITTDKIKIDDQLEIIKKTNELRKQAKASWKTTDNLFKSAIDHIKVDKKHAVDGHTGITDGILTMYKTYANLAQAMNAGYLKALAGRNRQALAICTGIWHATKKAEKPVKKEEPKKETKEEVKTEGFVTIDTFLGAVEFI